MSLIERVRKESDLLASRRIDIAPVGTVCLALGPYRNLTTLTAAVLFLHPNCQVLNHASLRILGDRRLDFIADYSDERFEAFVRYAVHISKKPGKDGGSIIHSHAFDNGYPMKNLFRATGLPALKTDIRALFWKESLRTSNHIRRHTVDLGELFSRNKRLKFLMPVRNPLDCTASNLRTGNVRFIRYRRKGSSAEEVLESILEELRWFKDLEARYPGRFFSFCSYEVNRVTLRRMAEFLGLEPCEDWVANALEAFDVRSRYRHAESLVSFFRQSVARLFTAYPDFSEKLMRFVDGSTTGPRGA